MNHYEIAIATGLTIDQAKYFATAMSHSIKPNISHLNQTLTI